MEWARTNAHRGFIAAWPQLGAPAGLLLANLALLDFSAFSGDQFVLVRADPFQRKRHAETHAIVD
jgi:hypothetical protein